MSSGSGSRSESAAVMRLMILSSVTSNVVKIKVEFKSFVMTIFIILLNQK